MSNLRKLPDFTQLDLFAAEFTDIATRMLQDIMWRPFFALGKRPRLKPIEYRTDNVEIKIVGSTEGIATIFDADILMWLISQIVEARDKGEPTSPQIYFTPYDCLKGIRRGVGGSQYRQLVESIERLQGTSVRTSIRQFDQIPLSQSEISRLKVGFSWIVEYGVQYVQHNGKEVIKGITVIIPNWLYKAVIKQRNVLTIDEDYFLLKSGLERVLYLIARKHVGRQRYYSASMKELYEKTASEQRFSDFADRIREILARNGLPQYHMMRSPKWYKVMCEGHSIELPQHLWEQEAVTFWNQESLQLQTEEEVNNLLSSCVKKF